VTYNQVQEEPKNMPYQVTIQIPVLTHDDKIWLFQKRGVMLNVAPFPGLLLTGRGIPQVLPMDVGWSSIVREVGEDLDTGMIFLNLAGLPEKTYTKEEILRELGPGWAVSPEPIGDIGEAVRQAKAQQDEDQGGYDDGYPKSSWDN
jgi:hypothetical protein